MANNETVLKDFDCLKWIREVRDQIYAETKDMSPEELKQHWDRIVREDPYFSRISKTRISPYNSRGRIKDS